MIETRMPSFLPNININPGNANSNVLTPTHSGNSAFDQFLDAAMNVVNETNMRIIESDIEQVRFATGQSNDMLAVVMAQERAGGALNFTVQVSQRIIEAYREIMRMQV